MRDVHTSWRIIRGVCSRREGGGEHVPCVGGYMYARHSISRGGREKSPREKKKITIIYTSEIKNEKREREKKKFLREAIAEIF